MTRPGTVALVIGVLLEFCAVAAIMLTVVPGPRASVDYLVIGTLSTFIALATVFGVLALTKKKEVPRKPAAGFDAKEPDRKAID